MSWVVTVTVMTIDVDALDNYFNSERKDYKYQPKPIANTEHWANVYEKYDDAKRAFLASYNENIKIAESDNSQYRKLDKSLTRKEFYEDGTAVARVTCRYVYRDLFKYNKLMYITDLTLTGLSDSNTPTIWTESILYI